VPKHSSIFLFSKTSHPEANHIPILDVTYFDASVHFPSYDYIIVSSKETILALDKIGAWKILPILAISEATAAFAKSRGAELLDIAQGYGESVVELIKSKYIDLKALYPHAKTVAYDIESELQKLGVELDAFVIYETSCSKAKKVELPSNAICIFTSPSSVKCFLERYELLATYKIVCIGETTASTLPKDLSYVLSEKTSVESTILKAKSLL